MTPNPQQQAVIEFASTGTGSLNLSARAGTGKTSTLLELVSKLEGATWFCAFNKAIVSEIEFKVSKRSDIDEGNVRVSTVHSAGMRAWNKHIAPKRNRVEGRKVRKMVDEKAETDTLFKSKANIITKLTELAKSAGFGVLCRINDTSAWEELIDHFGLDIEYNLNGDTEDIVDAAIRTYQRSLKLALEGDIDFSDMLLAPLYYKAKFPAYDNVLIDEAQDISPLRLKLILACLKPGGRVIAVGDPYQAIYGFTGADDKSMDTIRSKTGAGELPLTVTYRCPKSIVALAQTWVPDIEAHPSAPDGVILAVDLKPGMRLNEQGSATQALTFWDCAPFTSSDAILCRNTKPLVELAYQFLRKQIPCRIEGRDIGQGLINLATRWKKCKRLTELEVQLAEWCAEEVDKFTRMKQEYKAESIQDQVDTLLTLIDAAKDQGGELVEDVVALINRMFGDTPEGAKPECIILSTVHKSKGREWPRVFLLGRNRYMPSKWARKDWEKQQENNLQYVAVTRAMKELIEVHVPLK